jgi:hypothetical protein
MTQFISATISQMSRKLGISISTAAAQTNGINPGQSIKAAPITQITIELSTRGFVSKKAKKMAAMTKPTTANRRIVRKSLVITR